MKKLLLAVSLSCLLAGGAMAQRGGGGHGGGGGGGMHGGGGFGGGGMRGGGGFGGGGFRGGGFGGFRGGFGGFRGGFNNGFGFRNFGFRGFGGWGGGWGVGWGGYWPGYWGGGYGYPYDYPYDYGYYGGYPAGYGGGAYYPSSSYGYAPNTTVVYPPQSQPTTVYVDPPVHSSIHVYDEYGQEVGGPSASVRPAASPLYLIALQDHAIHAATSYRVDGNTLTYVTPQNEEKHVPLSSVDRAMTMQLNHERHVQMNLPQ